MTHRPALSTEFAITVKHIDGSISQTTILVPPDNIPFQYLANNWPPHITRGDVREIKFRALT